MIKNGILIIGCLFLALEVLLVYSIGFPIPTWNERVDTTQAFLMFTGSLLGTHFGLSIGLFFLMIGWLLPGRKKN